MRMHYLSTPRRLRRTNTNQAALARTGNWFRCGVCRVTEVHVNGDASVTRRLQQKIFSSGLVCVNSLLEEQAISMTTASIFQELEVDRHHRVMPASLIHTKFVYPGLTLTKLGPD